MLHRRAYTLLDMVIVVLILGILASVAAPKLLGVNKKRPRLSCGRTSRWSAR